MRIRALFGLSLIMMCLGVLKLETAPQKHVMIEQPNNLGMIKILLFKDLEAANLEVHGGYKLFDPKTGSKIGKGSMKKQYLLRPTLDGITWGEAYPGVFQVALVPNEKEGYFLVNGIQYSGNLYVYQVGNKISLVNEVPIEEFAKSMLNLKVNKLMHPETLAALAIIERTQAYYHALKNQTAFWHLDAQDIGYQGRGVCSRGNGVDKAVDLTHHLVMKSKSYGIQNGFFNATFTKHCGGKTAPYHLIYRKEGHTSKKAVESPLALANRNETHWVHRVDMDTLAEKLGWDGITSFEVFTDQNTGKVYGMKFQNKSESVDLDFFKLQSVLGDTKLKSTDFKVVQKDNMIVFEGYGQGLGVGACLYTAEEMARRGHNAAEILDMFFPGTIIAYMDIIK